MGYMIVHGPCWVCGKLFSYNAERVPSVRHPDPVNSPRQPVCLSCMTETNEARAQIGMPPHVIHPDAYEPQQVE